MEKSAEKPPFGLTPTGWLQATVILAAVAFAFLLILGSGGPGKTAQATPLPQPGNAAESNATDLASCLAEKGAVFYGTEWCGHCTRQKEMFGSDFGKISYVDCGKSPNLCQLAGITAYPTWIINGEKHLGAKSMEALGALAGCGAGA